MRVLYLCHRIPFPPDKGDKIRSYHLLTFLAKRGDVDLVTHVDDPRDLRHVQILRDACRSVEVYPLNGWVGKLRALSAIPTGKALSLAYMTRPSAGRRVASWLGERPYDLIVGYSSQVAAYLPKGLQIPVIFDLVDVDSEKWAALAGEKSGFAGWVPRLEARRVLALEKDIAARSERVILTTPQEADLFRQRTGANNVVAIGNGVVFPDRVPPQAKRDGALVVFVGTMDYLPNVEAVVRVAERIWPRVRIAVPHARFRIVGRNPHPRVQALASLPGIEVTGEVPDLQVHLHGACAALVPLRIARGVQNKVLEALAYGVPVVATPAVRACMHSDVTRCLVAAEGDDELAGEVIKLLDDPYLREDRGEKAREFVRRHHDWHAIDGIWGSLIGEVLGRARR